MSDDIEWLKDENQRLRHIILNRDNELMYFPWTLKKAIAKGDIRYDNLTAESWFEIYQWFYLDRYDEYPTRARSEQQESQSPDQAGSPE